MKKSVGFFLDVFDVSLGSLFFSNFYILQWKFYFYCLNTALISY